MPRDDLADFTASEATFGGTTRTVYRAGSGPAVIVIHEVPGITPAVAGFARRVARRGMTVVVPSLFGDDGREPTGGYTTVSLARACISREFACMATGTASPITGWLRDLAVDAHAECGGPGVGVVGMCLTGGFALAMMTDESVVAPVLSQPALPFPVGAQRRRSPGVSKIDLARVRERVAAGCPVLGLRFSEDRASPAARFDTLREALGDGFIAVEIDSSPGNPHGIGRRAHSVLTEDLVDVPGHPTRQALDTVLRFLEDRLR